MFEEILNNINGSVFAICEYDGDLVVVPCDDEMSGIYPIYKERKVILKNFNQNFKVFNKLIEIDEAQIDAIVFMEYKGRYEMHYAQDCYDGFQLLTE